MQEKLGQSSWKPVNLYFLHQVLYKTAERLKHHLRKKKRFCIHVLAYSTIEILQNKLAKLEGAETCWAASTGMAAVFTIFMSYLKKGDRVVTRKSSVW